MVVCELKKKQEYVFSFLFISWKLAHVYRMRSLLS
jgi:hypothetical protein